MSDIDLDTKVLGAYGRVYTLGELKDLCPSWDEIRVLNKEESENHRQRNYHSQRYNSTSDNLPGEIWVRLNHEGCRQYYVSNLARVKWVTSSKSTDIVLLQQADKKKAVNVESAEEDNYENNPIGYLVLDTDKTATVDHSVYVYTLVAMAFLGKKIGDGKHVHHIDNNGYDCRPENLILLDRGQHLNTVHHD